MLGINPDFLRGSVFGDALVSKREVNEFSSYESIFDEVVVERARTIRQQHPGITDGKATCISRCELIKEEERFLIKSFFTHPANHWRAFKFKKILAHLTYYCPLFCLDSISQERGDNPPDPSTIGLTGHRVGYSREEFPPYQKGSSKIVIFVARSLAYFDAILLVLGWGYALWGLLASFKRYTEGNKEKLLRGAVLSHIVGFCVMQGILVVEVRYFVHCAFLSSFLGWWAVADFCGFCKKRKRIAQNKVA
jgi:hypothetical protein